MFRITRVKIQIVLGVMIIIAQLLAISVAPILSSSPTLEPVAIDHEIGTNDFRLSDMGGDKSYDAWQPEIAYNNIQNQYLVV